MNLAVETDEISTPFGITPIMKIGSGPIVIVLHGGPAFSYDYLIKSLEPLALKRTVIFYNQPTLKNIPATETKFTPLLIYAHFRWLASYLANGKPLGVIAHSWGGLVFIASLIDPRLSDQPSADFSEILLINPMPLSSQNLKKCTSSLFRRMSFAAKLKLLFLSLFQPDGNRIMKHLLPYYFHDVSKVPAVDFKLDKESYIKLTQQLKKFDYTALLPELSKVTIITSEHDFIKEDYIQDLVHSYSNVVRIKNSGHFPFFENDRDFQEALNSAFRG